MASRGASMSRAVTPAIHLICSNCDRQLGIFQNEWIRLTSSYARAKHDGRHTNTEIGELLQYVPAGTVQAAAEGCGMADVFCKGCSETVARYCKSVPSAEKQHLLHAHFYKLSRTYLIDPETSNRIEPVFAYSGDLVMPPPRPRASVRPSRQPSIRPRMSVRPSASYTPRDSLGTFSDMGNRFRQSVDRQSFAEVREDSLVAERLSFIERRMSEYDSDRLQQSRTITPLVGFENGSQSGSRDRSLSQQDSDQAHAAHDQRKQILALTSQVQTLNETVQDLRSLIKDMRSERQLPSSQPPSAPGQASNEEARIERNETVRLREENKNLRSRFALMERAMGANPGSMSQLDSSPNEVTNRVEIDDAQTTHRLKSRETVASCTQPLARANNEQPSLSDSETTSTIVVQDTSHQATTASKETLFRQAIVTQTMEQQPSPESVDETQVDEDHVQVGGDDEVDKLAADDLKLSKAQISQGSVGAGSNNFPGEVSAVSLVYVYPGKFASGASVSSVSATQEESRPQVMDSPQSEAPPARPVRPNQPLFGVIKLPSAKERLKQERLRKAAKAKKPDAAMPRSAFETPLQHQSQNAAPVIPLPRTIDLDVVCFSDDEDITPQVPVTVVQDAATLTPVVLHYGRGRRGPPSAPGVSPWAIPTSLPPAQPLANSTLNISEGEEEELEFDITVPNDIKEIIEREESGIKLPKPKKVHMQTTEKLLNQELTELGLEEWIGKPKTSKEYRQLVTRAREERRERKKNEALAKAGVINSETAAAQAPPPAPASKMKGKHKCERPSKHKSLQSLRRQSNRFPRVAKPLADVTDQQNVQSAAGRGKKRKASVVEEVGVPDSNQKLDDVAPDARRVKKSRGRDTSGAVQEEPQRGIKTRGQMREAEIDKLDKLAQEAMEMDEVTL